MFYNFIVLHKNKNFCNFYITKSKIKNVLTLKIYLITYFKYKSRKILLQTIKSRTFKLVAKLLKLFATSFAILLFSPIRKISYLDKNPIYLTSMLFNGRIFIEIAYQSREICIVMHTGYASLKQNREADWMAPDRWIPPTPPMGKWSHRSLKS